jgi:acyl-CoA synthetase (AMP-forming)/AMP-acid ligase II
MAPMNVGQLLADAARRHPERPAVSWGDRRLDYRSLDRRTNALARALADLGVSRGDRVGMLMRNRPEMLEAMFACFKGGLCLVPLNSRFTADEVAYHVEDSGAVAVLTDDEGADIVLEGTGPSRDRVHVVVASDAPLAEGALSHEQLIEATDDGPATVPVDRDELAWLFYTSGTTGRPKGAMLTHANLAFATASWLADLTPMTEHDVTLHAAPLSHGAGFHALAATARGAHQVIPPTPRFDPAGILEILVAQRVTNTWMVPTQIVMLLDHVGDDAPALPDLQQIVYGGAPFAPADLRRALEVFGPVFVQLYAQGETPMTATVMPAADHAAALAGDRPERLASAGYARPGVDVRVLDDHDVEVAVGAVGEVCVQGPAVMLGYWQRPEESTVALRNGWLHTGDLGRFDEHGYLYLLDRAKDLIITGGSNVYAVEIEATLVAHPSVQEAAVVGVADRTWGEVVVAVIVGDPDAEAALREHCRVALAGYKQPRRYEFVDGLPRNAYGKVLKRELRDRFS